MTLPSSYPVRSRYRLKSGRLGKVGRCRLISAAVDRAPVGIDHFNQVSDLAPYDCVDLRFSHCATGKRLAVHCSVDRFHRKVAAVLADDGGLSLVPSPHDWIQSIRDHDPGVPSISLSGVVNQATEGPSREIATCVRFLEGGAPVRLPRPQGFRSHPAHVLRLGSMVFVTG